MEGAYAKRHKSLRELYIACVLGRNVVGGRIEQDSQSVRHCKGEFSRQGFISKMEKMTESSSPNLLKVVAKAFLVLEAIADCKSCIRVTELSRKLKVPKATVFRILFTLKELGYVQQIPRRGAYKLSDQARWLSRNEAKETLKRVARPFMQALLARYGETVNLAVIDRGQILYIRILEGIRSFRMTATENTYSPVHTAALGKAILAFLDPREAEQILRQRPLAKLTSRTTNSIPALLEQFRRVRKQGWAIDDQENEQGVRCLGAPIFDSQGNPGAAMSISGPCGQLNDRILKEVARFLLEASREISRQIGYTGKYPPDGGRGVRQGGT